MKYMHILLWCAASASFGLHGKDVSEWVNEAKKRIVTETLPNGLTVVCYPLPGSYKVHVGITYNRGSKDELPHEHGMAHLVEHMIFKGTQKMSEMDLKAIAQKYGIGGIGDGYNAQTSRDLTRYFFQADKHSWPIFMNILADCMFHVRFDDNHFASEVKAVIEELTMRSTKMGAFIWDEHCSLLYPQGHPYHHSQGGYKDVVLRMTPDDLKTFYKSHYHPNNALLTVIGDVDPEEVCKAARAAFAEGRPVPSAPAIVVPAVADVSQKKAVFYKPIEKEQCALFWRFPADLHMGDYARCIAQLLEERLERILVRQKDWVYDVSVFAIQQQLDGVIMCMFDIKKNQAQKEIKAAIRAEIEKLRTEGVAQSDLERFKKKAEADFLTHFENSASLAQQIDFLFFSTRSVHSFFGMTERLEKMMVSDMKQFAATYIDWSKKSEISCRPLSEQQRTEWQHLKEKEDAYEQSILAMKIRETAIEEPRYVHELPDHTLSSYRAQYPDKVITLSNGLQVILKKRDNTPFIAGSLRFKEEELYKIERAVEGQMMVSSYAMTMLDEGTSLYSKEDNKRFFELRGALSTVAPEGIHFSCLSQHLAEVVGRELVILKDPAYDKNLLGQYAKSLEEQLKHHEKDPFYMASSLLDQEILKKYSWQLSHSEMIKQLRKVSRRDLVTFNKQFVQPKNMFLVLVGSIDLDAIVDDLERMMGTWKQESGARELVAQRTEIPIIESGLGTEKIHTIPSEQVVLAFGRVADRRGTKEHLALRVIELYLHQKVFEIRERSGLFYGYQLSLCAGNKYEQGCAKLLFPLSVSNVATMEQKIKELLAHVAQHGIPAQDIAEAKLQQQMSFLKMGMSNNSLVTYFAQIALNHEEMDYYEKLLAAFEALTKQEIDDVARAFLDPASWTVMKVGRIEDPHKQGEQPPAVVESRSWWSRLFGA